MPDEPWLTTSDVARQLGVTRRTVGKWVESGVLVPTLITPGRKFRWHWSDVEDQLRAQRPPSPDVD